MDKCFAFCSGTKLTFVSVSCGIGGMFNRDIVHRFCNPGSRVV